MRKLKGSNIFVFNVVEILNLFPNSTPFVIMEPTLTETEDGSGEWLDEEVLNNEKGSCTLPLLKYGTREVAWITLRGRCLEIHLRRLSTD